jgi:hypothetical protein
MEWRIDEFEKASWALKYGLWFRTCLRPRRGFWTGDRGGEVKIREGERRKKKRTPCKESVIERDWKTDSTRLKKGR